MIPHKDIRFVQRKVFQLLYKSKGIDEVKNLIKNQGGDENQVHTLEEK
jgi:hypothetical protein